MSVANPHFITSPDTLARDERRLFDALVREPARVITKDELMREVFGISAAGSTRRLDAAACRLRRKLEEWDGRRAVCNVWGVGYRYSDAAAARVDC